VLDRIATAWIAPSLNRAALALVRLGVGADAVTIGGFMVGLLGAVAIARHEPLIGLVLLALGRLADGLDGAIARQTGPSGRGAFLDITLDFLYYASVPLAFAIADPPANALPAAVLLAAFMGTASSFLAFAAIAAQRGWTSATFPNKGLYYLGGLTEATETLACFALMCLWPQHFALLAYGFAALCALTIATRLWAGWKRLA
jgi:phosphatidylglycerophosphate synthase